MNEKGINKTKGAEGAGLPAIIPQEYVDEISNTHTVKYFKGSIDEPSDIMMIQSLETKSMLGDEIILTDRQTNFFEGQFFIVLRYLEKRP